MPLPELRCGQDHTSKSIVRILFNHKCGLEAEIEIGGRRGKTMQDSAKDNHHHMDSSGILLVVLHAGLLGAGSP